jgi:hypothetical protein
MQLALKNIVWQEGEYFGGTFNSIVRQSGLQKEDLAE